ncbi:unnamed protein product [Caenorhabditis angaria]|uniref:Uncharacterized protein n=1 Tax=Caenorhabditis angaria TaxID=860376 RepID=A0A9P1IFI5_9PELO|nr:unnamed protein product [Caenorhabditis angaria]
MKIFDFFSILNIFGLTFAGHFHGGKWFKKRPIVEIQETTTIEPDPILEQPTQTLTSQSLANMMRIGGG